MFTMDTEDQELLLQDDTADEDELRNSAPDFELRNQRLTFEDAVNKTASDPCLHIQKVFNYFRAGNGRFHYRLLLLCGWALTSEAVEIISVSYTLSSATCEYKTAKFQNAGFMSVFFVGMVLGSLIWSNLADLNGRRPILVMALSVSGLFGLASSLAQSLLPFVIFRFFCMMGVGGSLPVIFSYYSEFQSKNHRGRFISLLASFWMCGGILAAALAWLAIPIMSNSIGRFVYTGWHIYLTLCTIPSLTSALLFLFMPESPKYLVESGRSEEAYDVLQMVFCENNRDRVESDFPVSRFYWIADRIGCRPNAVHFSSGGHIRQFFTGIAEMFVSWARLFAWSRLRTTLLTIAISFIMAFSYYGLTAWLPRLFEEFHKLDAGGASVCRWETNKTIVVTPGFHRCTPSSAVYERGLIISLASLPGNILSVVLVDRIGRKPLMIGSMIMAGASVFFVWLINTSTSLLVVTCVFAGFTDITYNVLDIITVELYPTALRSTAGGFLLAISQLAAILGNTVFIALVDANCFVPLTIVAGLLVCGAILSAFLPETKRAALE